MILKEFEIINVYLGIEGWGTNRYIYLYSETAPSKEGNYWHQVDGL